ncbi:MAG: hypothetical protein HQL81_01965 [Magnetococcales bacterium]|nr:hypothetical protein [Magnetococcales bacterium]
MEALVLVLLTELAGLECLEFHGSDRLRREGALRGMPWATWLERVCGAICSTAFSSCAPPTCQFRKERQT